jgi:hypothetical protein
MGKPILADPDLCEELLFQNFAGVGVSELLLHRGYTLRFVRTVSGSRQSQPPADRISPPEADSPLLVDADAHLTGAVALEDLEPVARRIAQVRGGPGGIELTQFPQCSILDLSREGAADPALPDTLGVLAFERPDHRSPPR